LNPYAGAAHASRHMMEDGATYLMYKFRCCFDFVGLGRNVRLSKMVLLPIDVDELLVAIVLLATLA